MLEKAHNLCGLSPESHGEFLPKKTDKREWQWKRNEAKQVHWSGPNVVLCYLTGDTCMVPLSRSFFCIRNSESTQTITVLVRSIIFCGNTWLRAAFNRFNTKMSTLSVFSGGTKWKKCTRQTKSNVKINRSHHITTAQTQTISSVFQRNDDDRQKKKRRKIEKKVSLPSIDTTRRTFCSTLCNIFMREWWFGMRRTSVCTIGSKAQRQTRIHEQKMDGKRETVCHRYHFHA